MQVDFLDRYSRGDTPIHRLDPRVKLVTTCLMVVCVVATPWSWWPAYGVVGAIAVVLIALARLPLRYLVVRLAAVLPFVLFLAASMPLSRGLDEGWILAAQLLVQSVISLVLMINLVATTPFRDLLSALERLYVPRVIVSILAFMYRYLFVLTDELAKMRRAKLARTFYPSLWWEVRLMANFVGILFVRAFERAERVYAAMCARGWSGSMPTNDEER